MDLEKCPGDGAGVHSELPQSLPPFLLTTCCFAPGVAQMCLEYSLICALTWYRRCRRWERLATQWASAEAPSLSRSERCCFNLVSLLSCSLRLAHSVAVCKLYLPTPKHATRIPDGERTWALNRYRDADGRFLHTMTVRYHKMWCKEQKSPPLFVRLRHLRLDTNVLIQGYAVAGQMLCVYIPRDDIKM
jgi:hypothetical protein